MVEIQETPDDQYPEILGKVKYLAHADAVAGSKQEAPAGVLDSRTVVAMDPAGRLLLLETMGARAPDDPSGRRHFKDRSKLPPDSLDSPKPAVLAHLATLIGEQRLEVGRRLGFD